MAAVAATLLAAGTVAALGSNHFAFAWHKEYKKSYGEDNKYGRGDKYGKDEKRDGDQYLKCIVIGGGSEWLRTIPGPTEGGGGISDHSCNNYDGGNDNSESDGSSSGTIRDFGDW
jgi:hypothetical protein